MSTYFISDLHLCAERPHTIQLFDDFLNRTLHKTERLFILGDLFESWVGDDYQEPCLGPALKTLRRYTESVPTGFIHGNRDFLIADTFARQHGIDLLPEVNVIDLYGVATLIMHGDTLCTDDHDYQAVRAQVRQPEWIRQVLSLPLQQRLTMAKQYRMESQARNGYQAEHIIDVTQTSVEKAMRDHDVHRLIHGHTHRPNIHQFDLDGTRATRIVLGDWDTLGSALVVNAEGYQLTRF